MYWEDALAPCKECVYPCITIILSNVDPNKKDRLVETLRRRQVPFALFNMLGYTAIESCNFAVTFDQGNAIITIDPPKDKVRESVGFVFDILREVGLDPRVTVDEVVVRYKGFPIRFVDGVFENVSIKYNEWYKGLQRIFARASVNNE